MEGAYHYPMHINAEELNKLLEGTFIKNLK